MPVTLPPIFYENDDPYYRSYLTEIEDCLNQKHFTGEKLLNAFQKFIESNMLSKEVWYAVFVLLEDRALIWEAIALFEIPSMYQLYYPQDNLGLFSHFGYGYFLQRKLVFNKRKNIISKWKETNEDDDSLVKDVQMLVDHVTYPHPDLKKIWQFYERNTCASPPKDLIIRYNKALELYSRLTTFDGSDAEWVDVVLEADDADFIKHNFEYILGSEMKDKKLWEKYLAFLSVHDTDTMLHTYSKYCRLFREEEASKEKYCNAVKEYCEDGYFTVPWNNPFSFERYDELFFPKYFGQDQPSIAATTEPIKHQPLSFHFSYDNAIRSQSFPFKDSLIHYILQNASADIQQKLSFCCKYFYLRKPTFICHSLKIKPGCNRFYQQSVHLNSLEMENFYDYVNNIYVSMVLHCENEDQKCLSKIISRMQQCSAKYITITDQELTSKEFEFLVGHGNVIELNMFDVKIIKDNGELLYLEDIIAMMPSIERISGDNIPTNKETLPKLLAISFKSKFDKIFLKSLNVSHFNPEQVIEFLKKNVASDCEVGINFWIHGNEEEIDVFAHTVYFGIWGFWKGSDRPSFRLLP